MKNYFKKFSIMFVMSLILVLGCCVSAFATDDGVVGTSNLNNTVENSAKKWDILKSPEVGWKRYDDDNINITYDGRWNTEKIEDNYLLTSHFIDRASEFTNNRSSYKFNFYGTKIRIIACYNSNHSSNEKITIDGEDYYYSTSNSSKSGRSALCYELLGLKKGNHSVTVSNSASRNISLDAVDIDENGQLKPYNEGIVNESISLDNTAMNLILNNSQQLTATTTPAGAEVVWTSSDETIATVDSTGKVTAIKEGQATITAQIKDSETKATCTVIVTKSGTTTPTEPTNPTESTTGDGNLFIEMVDGNVKQAQNIDVADFIKWFKNRDLDDNDNPIYKIKNAKGNVEYLVHDKVVGFEVR